MRAAPSRCLLAAVLALGALPGCGDGDGDASPDDATADATEPTTAGVDGGGERITIEGSEALVWGDGGDGVVLAHGAAFDAASWEGLATRIAAAGDTVVAVEDISPDAIGAAVAYLRDDRGVDKVALVGGSAGADAILQLVSERKGVGDQLILLSPNRTVDGLGPEPKLLVAGEDEVVTEVSRQLASTAPGDDNEVILVPGSDHAQNLLDGPNGERVTAAILDRLADRSTT